MNAKSERLHSQANVLTLQFGAFISQGTRCDVSILLPIYSKNDVIRRGGIFVANIATVISTQSIWYSLDTTLLGSVFDHDDC